MNPSSQYDTLLYARNLSYIEGRTTRFCNEGDEVQFNLKFQIERIAPLTLGYIASAFSALIIGMLFVAISVLIMSHIILQLLYGFQFELNLIAFVLIGTPPSLLGLWFGFKAMLPAQRWLVLRLLPGSTLISLNRANHRVIQGQVKSVQVTGTGEHPFGNVHFSLPNEKTDYIYFSKHLAGFQPGQSVLVLKFIGTYIIL